MPVPILKIPILKCLSLVMHAFLGGYDRILLCSFDFSVVCLASVLSLLTSGFDLC